MAKVFPMFSSSSGNCTYIGDATGGLLIDAGVSFKRIQETLGLNNIPLEKIKAVLVTHEHGDHIRGLKTLLKKTGAPLLASRDTVYTLEFQKVIDDDTPRIYIDDYSEYSVEAFTVRRFPTSHDCKGSSGYTVKLSDGRKIGFCTDLGIVTDEVKSALIGSELVVLESNHDPVMLRLGPYKPELKIRVGGDMGHLANAVSAALAGELFKTGTRRFVLAHLSENNNTPEKAESAARAALVSAGAKSNDYILYVAKPEGNRVISL
ncbi:MAG: MBL fold metallo-hydrolase [Clostridia bacterium]|nr:MBL fold metallo-hydrolase [Clostridia bacterium]